jgi:hypothetical protein
MFKEDGNVIHFAAPKGMSPAEIPLDHRSADTVTLGETAISDPR